jgi:predicted transcriptional regulator
MPDGSITVKDKDGLPEPGFTPRDTQKLRGVDPQDIIQRVAEGELVRDVAKDYGVTRSAVSHYIRRHVPKDTWDAVREQSIAARLEQSIADMDTATAYLEGKITIDDETGQEQGLSKDALARANITLACAREKAKLWMWRAERELPHLYGQRTQVTHDIGPDLGNMLRDARKRVADTTHAAVLSPVTIDNDTQTPD